MTLRIGNSTYNFTPLDNKTIVEVDGVEYETQGYFNVTMNGIKKKIFKLQNNQSGSILELNESIYNSLTKRN